MKNLGLMDEIMGAITQTDEWCMIQDNDPRVVAADKALGERLAALRPNMSHDEYDSLESAVFGAQTALADAAILYGIHVADTIRDVSSRGPALSQYIMDRMEEKQV